MTRQSIWDMQPQQGSGWVVIRTADAVCPMSEKKWPHCSPELLVLPVSDIVHAWILKQMKTERKEGNN